MPVKKMAVYHIVESAPNQPKLAQMFQLYREASAQILCRFVECVVSSLRSKAEQQKNVKEEGPQL